MLCPLLLPLTVQVAAEEPEIVVMAEKARKVRWDWRLGDHGELTKCRITVSSGDPEIDALGCEATRRCGARGFAGKPRRQLIACIVDTRRDLLVALRDARAEARSVRAERDQH